MEKEITNADVKKEWDDKNKSSEQAEATEESSTEETKASESSTEDVKTVTEETSEKTEETTKSDPKVIPYSRFKEVNDKLKTYEELEREATGLIERGPDGNLRIKVIEKAQEKEDKGLELTEEEQLALDSVQVSVVDKLVNRALALRERQTENQRVYREESSKWWSKAQEEFPEVKNMESDLYKRADKIFREQYVQFSKDGKQWTSPANAHYLSCLQAEKELAHEKVKTGQAKIEESKNKKQQVFVEKKSVSSQTKKKVDEKEFERMTSAQREESLREEWDEKHHDEE